ncbi:5'-nucleotidase [Amycolatopsis sp. NPDC059021]|uniref:5'-nucleotidase n=1 Tax=Amycolatopsis sp. NPDC059021 TaxID=3346704 RepID=UPI00367146F5
MPYKLDGRLVVGIASSALFDLSESDAVLHAEGEEAYRRYQEDRLDDPLDRGVAFPFIKRLLSLNDLSEQNDPLVKVIILSRNAPDTGLRVMRSIADHNLSITRAIFTRGESPYRFMRALNMSLFLSANERDVREAIACGLPAGRVLNGSFVDDEAEELRVAFDFDGVLADDKSERIMQSSTLEEFHSHESANLVEPHSAGPLHGFLLNVNRIQQLEEARRASDESYKLRVRVSIVTARSAPSHERAVLSLKSWGVTVDNAFFLGGVEKVSVLGILKPHIFFDDQSRHLDPACLIVPCVHVPFGVANER